MEVWHVRHGERCDEVKGPERGAWTTCPGYKEGRHFDPPLTKHGHVQATRAGIYLKDLNMAFSQDPHNGFDIIYVSPLVRAVQTAANIAREMSLPMQVVPGLCSLTAAMVRVGFANATLMSDADIAEAFPSINLVPRDSTAPDSFHAAAGWLTRRSKIRVLSVGHREGTKALAGRKVPTPHCCIGIFRVDLTDRSFELYDLLSGRGESLRPEPTVYAKNAVWKPTRGTTTSMSATRSAIDAGVSVLDPSNHPSKLLGGERWWKRALNRKGQVGGRRQHGSNGKNSSETKAAVTGGHQTPCPSGVIPPAASAVKCQIKSERFPSNAAAATAVYEDRQRQSTLPSTKSQVNVTERGVVHASASAAVDATASKSGKRLPGSGAKIGDCKAAPEISTPEKACAGHGFRVALLARRPVSERAGAVTAGSANAGLLGVSIGTDCGSMGFLSFMHPSDLCHVQATCKAMASAAINERLWIDLYSLLSQRLRDEAEDTIGHGNIDERGIMIVPTLAPTTAGKAPAAADDVATTLAPLPHHKALFSRAVSIGFSHQATKAMRKTTTIRRRVGVIYDLRDAVGALKISVDVSVNDKPAGVVNSRRIHPQQSWSWTSQSTLLREPSTCHGVRTFSLSSSLKVIVPAELSSSLGNFRSICASLSWRKKWLPRRAIVRLGGESLLSGARLLGRSEDDAVALYDVSEYGADHDPQKGMHDTATSGLPTTPRGCVLLGVLDDGKNDRVDAGAFAFLTVHFPHQLLLDAATRPLPLSSLSTDGTPGTAINRRSRLYGDDSTGPNHGLENFAVAIGLRTGGVPLWEAKWIGVDGRLFSPCVLPGTQNKLSSNKARRMICVDLIRAGCQPNSTRTDRALNVGPRLPYFTTGGLHGAVENVLLADCALCDPDGASLWAFTSPIVFERVPLSARNEDDEVVDMACQEVRKERRRGVVETAGVGRLVVELALVESDKGEWHTWVVRVSRLELELSFINDWFGTSHGSA